ncbi:MAG TPA: hypothetical protein VL243_11485, partial [Vicinamibacterales bacterium]|nr:hypothetical protein [Vicinamibacterales bacterium]
MLKRWPVLVVVLLSIVATMGASQNVPQPSGTSLRLSGARSLDLDGWFYETASGRTPLPAALTGGVRTVSSSAWSGSAATADGRTLTLTVTPQRGTFAISLKAQPSTGIVRWGVAIDAASDEYFTGLMERVVDGPQQASWAPGITAAMDLRGQKIEMIVKPTTSVYAPFYVSSRGYGVFVKGSWPGRFDFA